MFNLHCHSILSDGDLIASEIAVRYAAAGYTTIAITDHADYSNIKNVVSSILDFTRHWPKNSTIKVLAGVELTHVPLDQFKPLVKYARSKGIQIIVGHGESPVEPVIKGTNRAALESGIDILAHPGLISDEDVVLAGQRKIFLEVSSRRGHGNTNNHVANRACALGARLVINTDGHSPEDIITPAQLRQVGITAGLTEIDLEKIYADVAAFLKVKEGRR
ncbi:MAG TPA: histidinol phosphate phosphatase domain-containing protein [Candidatus Omnitrophota bacterium]|nr:histidinol phosphate phosphatase domain-containing protein [Candidatus Omnitrophota bacterium]HPT07830.1 histidinol phosphate phosphatase domain-containing protein [Candidatus Omnitrophota bacterium]